MGERLWIEATTIGDLLDRAASECDGDAVVLPDERASYPELAAMTDRCARSLRGLGVAPGDKVGILMPNCLDFVVTLIGAAKLGAVAVPINGRFKATELGHVVTHGDVKVLLTAQSPDGTDYPMLIAETFPHPRADGLPELIDLHGETPGFLTRAQFEAAADHAELAEVRRLQERVTIRSVGMLMYTSGTTARPKGCLLTHEALVRHASTIARSRFLLTREDRFWDVFPMFHIGGITPMYACFTARCAYVHSGFFQPGPAFEQLERERITVAYTFELLWGAILNLPEFEPERLRRVRLVMNIALPEKLAQYERAMPWARQVSSFGSTESASHVTVSLPSDPQQTRWGTLGTTPPGIELRIVDPETNVELPAGEVGELVWRGYNRFEGYYKDPDATAQAIDAGGWFHTGDLGSLDPDGRLVFAGRLKDMLKVGGENVSALEVEDYLASHPAVGIAQVVAAPDARYTEVPVAYIELKPGADQPTEAELIDFCVGEIASFKVPRYVRFVDEWPLSGTKIQKFVLRDRIAVELKERGIVEAPRVGTRRGAAESRSPRAGRAAPHRRPNSSR
jgi:fatty-acyl-CoA synthase